MYSFGLILVVFLVGHSCARRIRYAPSYNFPYDYYSNYYQPSIGSSLWRSPFPLSQIGNINSLSYLTSAPVVGSDLLSTIPADIAYNYPYASPRTVGVDKENYIRDYGYGSTEVGVRDQVSVRSNVPSGIQPNSWQSLFPFSQTGSVNSPTYLSLPTVGSDLLSTIPADFTSYYPYASTGIEDTSKANYVSDYGYGEAAAGVKDPFSVRSNAIFPPYTSACSLLPIEKCRGINRFNQQSAFPLLTPEYEVTI